MLMQRTQLIIVRHGQTEWNIAGIRQGHLDSRLTSKGVAQAQALAQRLAREKFSALYSSDLGRAVQTATVVADLTGHEIVTDPRLPERHLGADIRSEVAGDPSPDGKGVLAIQRGIEVGHVFYLGTKYSKAMNATYLDEASKPQLLEMGCYGIGVTRILGAAIEQGHDERGIIWPDAIAPFRVAICPIGYDRSEDVRQVATRLHDDLEALGVDAILDDRGERPGAMFADWELIGLPHRVVVSERGLKEGMAEYQGRREAEATKVAIGDLAGFVAAKLRGQ